MEPEMTCLAEEDAKHEAFSTRIGRSFTFQKRSHFENEKYVYLQDYPFIRTDSKQGLMTKCIENFCKKVY